MTEVALHKRLDLVCMYTVDEALHGSLIVFVTSLGDRYVTEVIAEVRVILIPHFGHDLGRRHFIMLRTSKKRQREVIHVVTPGAQQLATTALRSQRRRFNTPSLLVPVVAAASGAGLVGETLRRFWRRSSQNPKPKVTTQNQIEADPITQGYSRYKMPKKYPGIYSGRFRKAKAKPNVYNGVVFKQETGYNVSDDDGTALPGGLTSPTGCVWTGVTALVWQQFPRNVLLAILRKLCSSKGFEFNSADDKIQDTFSSLTAANVGTFQYIYTQSGAPNPIHRTVNIVVNNTWEDLAQAWLNDMIAHITSYHDIQFQKCFIQSRVDNVNNYQVPQSVMALNMIGLQISFTTTHTLFIQNRTRDTGGGDTTDAVDTNPLMGRIYMVKGSYLKSDLIQNTDVTWGVPNDGSGRFIIEPQKWVADSDQQQLFSRVVPRSAINGCYKVANVQLQPGEIKKASVTFKDKMAFNRLFFMAFMPGLATSWDFPIRYGKSMVVALQKVVRTATVDSQEAYDSRIQIACTNRQYFQIEAHPKRKTAFIPRNLQPEVA